MFQQSLNEIFASKLHEMQGFDNFTKYSLAKIRVDGNVNGIGCMSYYFPLKKVCLGLGMSEENFNSFMDYEIRQ